jgi:hypothetical protein
MLGELYSKIKPFLIKEPYDGKDPPCIVQLLVSRISLKDMKDLLTFAQILAEYYIYFRLLKPDKVFNYLHTYVPELSEEDLINVIKKVLSSRPSKFYCSEFLLNEEDVKAYCRGEIEAKDVRTYEVPNLLLGKFCRKTECELLMWFYRQAPKIWYESLSVVENWKKLYWLVHYTLKGNVIFCKRLRIKKVIDEKTGSTRLVFVSEGEPFFQFPNKEKARECFEAIKSQAKYSRRKYRLKKKELPVIKLKFYISPEEVKEWLRQKP